MPNFITFVYQTTLKEKTFCKKNSPKKQIKQARAGANNHPRNILPKTVHLMLERPFIFEIRRIARTKA